MANFLGLSVQLWFYEHFKCHIINWWLSYKNKVLVKIKFNHIPGSSNRLYSFTPVDLTNQSKIRPTKGEIRVTPASAHATAWSKKLLFYRSVLQVFICSSFVKTSEQFRFHLQISNTCNQDAKYDSYRLYLQRSLDQMFKCGLPVSF